MYNHAQELWYKFINLSVIVSKVKKNPSIEQGFWYVSELL